MGRPSSIQWNVKQWLGDNKVLAMDWDARAMHFHLLMMSIQEEPAGSIPNDVGQIRRWLRLPSGQSESDRDWARVQPQIFAAWMLQDERWFNSGMVQTFEKKANYASRPQNSPISVPYRSQKPLKSVSTYVFKDLDLSSSRSKPSTKANTKPTLEEISTYCSERKNSVDPQKFWDYYASNGWKVGRNSMKDWRAAVRTWEKNAYQGANGKESKHDLNQKAISRVLAELYPEDDDDSGGSLPKFQAKR